MKKITTLLTLTFLSLSLFSQLPSYVPTNGLIGWYSFTGNPKDSSGNGNNGTVSGATLTTDRFGHSNSAYSFTSGTYISINDVIPLRLNNTDFTISAWVDLTDTLPQSVNYGEYCIVSKRNISGGYIYGITTNDNTMMYPKIRTGS